MLHLLTIATAFAAAQDPMPQRVPTTPGIDRFVVHGRTLEGWVTGLRHEDADVRIQAARMIGGVEMKDQYVIDALAVLLDDKDARARREGIIALTKIGSSARSTLPKMLKLLADDDATIREAACNGVNAAMWLVSEAELKTSVPLLLKRLEDPSAKVRKAAALALGLARLQSLTPKVGKALRKLLQSKVPSDRAAAAQAFSIIAQEEEGHKALPLLRKALNDENLSVRAHAAVALWQINFESQNGLPVLREALSSSDKDVRRLAAEALGRFGTDAVTAVGDLRKALRDKEPSVRAEAAFALWNADREAGATTPILVEALKSDNARAHRVALDALAQMSSSIPQSGIDRLEALLWHDDANVAQRAAVALANGSSSVPAVVFSLLSSGIDSQSPIVRQFAARALASVVDQRSKTALHRAAAHPDPLVRVMGKLGLVRAGHTKLETALPALTQALQSPDHDVQSNAAHSLPYLGADVIPAVLKVMKSKRRFDRSHAIVVCTHLGPKAATAVPALIQRLDDENFDTRRWAARALGDIGPPAKEAVPALLKTIKDDEPLLRLWSARALGLIRHDADKCVPALIKLTDDKYDDVRNEAVIALKSFQKDAANAIPALKKRARDPHPSVRRSSLRTLFTIVTSPHEVHDVVLGALRDTHPNVRSTAIGFAVTDKKYARSLVEQFKRMVDDPDPLVRVEAARALWKTSQDEDAVLKVIAPILESPQSTNWQTVIALATAREMGPKAGKVLPSLLRMVQSERTNVRASALLNLRSIDPRAQKICPTLAKLVRSKLHPSYRLAVAQTLGECGKPAVPLIISCLEDQNRTVVLLGMVAARKLGDAAQETVPALRKLLKHDNAEVREFADFTLKFIKSRDADKSPEKKEPR